MKLSFSIETSRARKEMPDAIQVRPLTEEQARLVNPEDAHFTPGTPLPAISAGHEPIIFPPPLSTNLLYGDKKQQYGGTRNDTLRFFADNCPPIRVVIEQLKREMRGMAADIMLKNEDASSKKPVTEKDAKRDALRLWLRRPDGELLFGDWLNAVLEDVLVIGSMALARLRTVAGQPAGLRPLDAAIITPILTPTGRSPEAPAPAFYQYAYGLPYREFTRDELLYRPFNRRTWTPYGYSPVEATLMYVILALNRTVWYTNAYSESNLPPGFFTLPDSWSPAMIAEFDKLAVTMAGNNPERHHAQHYPKGTTYEQIKSDSLSQWQYEFDEFLMRVFAWSIGVSPQPIVKSNALNESGSGFSEEALAGGLKPYQDFIEEALDDYVSSPEVGQTCQEDAIPLGLGQTGYTVEWIEEREENREQQLKEDTELPKVGLRTINEVRVSRGDEPYDVMEYPEADQPMILTATGYVPLKGSSEPKPEPIPFGVPSKGETPPELATNAEKVKEQATEKPKPGEEDQAAKSDLAKWKRAAKADRRNGKAPREFASEAISIGTRNWIEKNLAFNDLTKAFRNPHRADLQTFSTSQRTAMALTESIGWWEKFLKSVAGHFIAAGVSKLEQTSKAEDPIFPDPDLDPATWSALVDLLSRAYEAGIGDSSELVGKGKVTSVGYAEQRAAELLGKRFVDGQWIDTPSKYAVSDTIRDQVRKKVVQAIEEGLSAGELRATLEQFFSDIPTRALMVARTETGFAYNRGALDNYREAEVTHVEVMDGGTEGSCEVCDALDGEVWTIEEAQSNPLEHPNCTRAFSPVLMEE